MKGRIKIVLTTILMITALVFNAKGTYANSLINDTTEGDDIYWVMQINEINEDIYDETTRGQTMYEYFNSGKENMSKIDKENLLFATRTYKVQDGIHNGFEDFCMRSSENGPIQGIMKPTLIDGQAVFSSKLKNTYQIFPSADVQTGENEIFKKIYTGLNLPVEKDGKIYTYNKECFYPNLEYDSFFTAKIQSTFKMTSDGKDDGEDLYFEVGGTDDIYVYIDGKLIIDLGGIHGNMYAKANFAEGSTFYQGMYNESIKDFEYGIEQPFEKLSEGEHTITVFYARRGAEENVYRMEYNLSNNPIETQNEEYNNSVDIDNNEEGNNQEQPNENICEENEEEEQDEYNENGSNNKNTDDEENDKKNRSNPSLVAQRPSNQKIASNEELSSNNSIANSNKNINTNNSKVKTELESKDAKALKTVESTDVKSLNTQNISIPNEEDNQDEIVNRTQNIKEPQSSKINFEDNSESVIMKQLNKLSIIHTILIAIVIILQLAILLKK